MNVCVISGLGAVTSRAAMHIYVRGGGLVAKLCPTLATPWTVACQAPLFMGFLRQEYWSGMPFPSPLFGSESGVLT